MTAAETEAACDAMPTQDQKPTIVTMHIVFDGVAFVPGALYDALNAAYGTVASDKDQRGFNQGDFQFRITA
jgi:hypothetical protein